MDRCRLCGKSVMTAVECHLHGGAVHEVHCPECEWFSDWHCLYGYKLRREEEERWREEQRAKREAAAAAEPKWVKMLEDWRQRMRSRSRMGSV